MTAETRLLVVGLVIVVALCITAAAALLLYPYHDTEHIAPVDTTPVTVFTVTNLPPPLTEATVTVGAMRGPTIQLTEPPPAPTTTLLTFADACAEMSWYRTQAGLPERFDRIGWRESRCTNDDSVHTSCCWSYWQLWVDLHLQDHRLIDPYHACGVYSIDDVNSNTALDKQRAACATAAVYAVVGYTAWSTS